MMKKKDIGAGFRLAAVQGAWRSGRTIAQPSGTAVLINIVDPA
jgi:hypothetical protein